MLIAPQVRRIDAILEQGSGLQSSAAHEPGRPAVVPGAECHQYCPGSPLETWLALRRLAIRRDDVFMDYGCGAGHVLAVACRFAFRRLLGVEVSAPLATLARRNLERSARDRQGCTDILTAEARQFALPQETSALYFFNPFKGAILGTVMQNVEVSYQFNPRPLRITFNTLNRQSRIEHHYLWLLLTDSFRLCNRISMYAVRPERGTVWILSC